MFNLFLLNTNKVGSIQTINNVQLVYIKPTKFKQLIDYKGYNSKPNLFIYNTTTKSIFNSKIWLNNIKLIYLIFTKLGSFNKIKFFILRAFFNILLLNSTTSLKLKFRYWLRWISITKHKMFINIILLNIYKIFLLLHNLEYNAQLVIAVKGKLGIRGNNKKKKNIYPFTTNNKSFNTPYYYYDGCGSSSNHGHSFLKIKYRIL